MDVLAIIGLGYVGLPLAIEFAKYFPTIGYDINIERVRQIKQCDDKTKEVEFNQIKEVLLEFPPIKSEKYYLHSNPNNSFCDQQGENSQKLNFRKGLFVSSKIDDIQNANIFIITVPTPIDKYNTPNLKPLLNATREVAKILKLGDLVIFESTVYPGCTEEECVPLLERISGLKFNQDFFVGYSPERIVPGDKINTLTKIKKVTSGSNELVANKVDDLYKTIIKAGTFKAASIKVAEAAKAIENAQRDVNISFVNELALIFDKMGIDTNDVLDAAETKFNFLRFKPGLVGGHCISVDPFYLAHKSSQLGYHPDVILSGRRVNDQMGTFIASKVVKLMTAKNIGLNKSRALILGLTFKENCADIRNSKVVDIYRELIEYGLKVDIYDPNVNQNDVSKQYSDLNLNEKFEIDSNNYLINNEGVLYEVVIIAVSHNDFKNIKLDFILNNLHVIFDVKAILPRDIVDGRL